MQTVVLIFCLTLGKMATVNNRQHQMLATVCVGEGILLHGENVNDCNCYGRQYGGSSKK
jgi:hypothetical protein